MSRVLDDNLEAVHTTGVSHGEDVMLANLVKHASTFRGGHIRSNMFVVVDVVVPNHFGS